MRRPSVGVSFSPVREQVFRAYQRRRVRSPRLRRAVTIIPGVRRAHRYLYEHVRPCEISVSVNGLHMLVDPADEVLARYLLQEGTWEPFETSLFEGSISPGMTVVDIGANIGYYTLIAARLVGDGGRVVAFEPDPHNYALLRRNVVRNGFEDRVTLVPAVVSDHHGHSTLYRDKGNLGAHSIARANVAGSDPLSVPCLTLDEALSDVDVSIVDVIKMDVQGAEGLVVAGASRVLAQGALKVFMELWPEGLQQVGTDPSAVLEALAQGYGFACRIIDEADRRLIDTTGIQDALKRCAKVGPVDLLLERGA